MLSSKQWDWLEEELSKEAEITVIASGVQVVILGSVNAVVCTYHLQVLQPTDLTKIEEYYCAHDSHSGGGNSFHEAIAKVFDKRHIRHLHSYHSHMICLGGGVILGDEAMMMIKVGEDDHWLGTYTESWGQVVSQYQNQYSSNAELMMSMMIRRGFVMMMIM